MWRGRVALGGEVTAIGRGPVPREAIVGHAPARTASLLLFASVALCVSPASAYRTVADDLGTSLPVLQGSSVVEVFVYGEGPPGVDPGGFAGDVIDAAGAWDLECSTLRFAPRGGTSRPPNDADGVTTISVVLEGWEARGYRPTQGAITELRFLETPTGLEITDGDVFLNGDTIDWAGSGAPDLLSVLVHELGHVGGLAHPCSHAPESGEPDCASEPSLLAQSVMYPDYQPGAWEPRADDIAGICELYSVEPCAAVTCQSDEACDAGECVPAPVCTSGDTCSSGVCAAGGEHDGQCIPLGSEGAPCAGGDHCLSSLCLTSMSAGSYCTRDCTADPDCGGLQRCAQIEGRTVCAPLPTSSCAVRPPAGRDTRAPDLPLVFALVFVGTRARRRRHLHEGEEKNR